MSLLPFFFNYTATPAIYTLSLHDALPICRRAHEQRPDHRAFRLRDHHGRSRALRVIVGERHVVAPRSEEHTSELQSRGHLVCRLLLEKKKKERKKVMRCRLESDAITRRQC